MKKITILLIFFLVCIAMNSCSKTEDLQHDQNRTLEVTPELLLTNIEIQAFANIDLEAALASRHLTYVNGANPNQYYNWGRGNYDNYDNINQVSKMIEETQRIESGVYEILGEFFISYFIISLTEVFGDVPYTDATNATKGNYAPVYDSQKSIYLKVLNKLKAASDALTLNNETILGDIIYKGDKLKWRKLINSYYLRVLMNLSKKEGDTEFNIATRFNEIYSNPAKYPIFESNDDNAALNYHNIEGNRYPLQDDNDLQTAYFMEQSFVERLQEYEDPRLFVFAEKKPTAAKASDTDFSAYGGLYGSGKLDSNTSKAVSKVASRVHPRYFTNPENEPSLLMSYSELEFILAEAASRNWITANIDTHYKKGIIASMQFYGITDISNYLDNPKIQLQSGNEIEAILTQKHIAMFLNTGWQIFYEQRRTGYPEFNTDGAGILNNGKIPKRWMYPAGEAPANGKNLNDAIQRQYPKGDDINAVMWLLQ